MSHYFKPSLALAEQENQLRYTFAGNDFTFTTNSGLFSRTHIDPASEILMRTIATSPPQKNQSLLDMGCGYGAIGIVLGKTYQLEITLADINPRGLKYAEKNAVNNKIRGKIILTDCFAEIQETFDIITINPPIHAGKSVTYKMYHQSVEHLNAGGFLYVVNLKKHGAETTARELEKVFGNCQTLYKKSGYYVFRCEKT